MSSWTPLHPQVTLHGKQVDEGLADLLNVLWRNGYQTRYSCQGGPGGRDSGENLDRAYILFDGFNQALRFYSETVSMLVDAVPSYFDLTLTERIANGYNILSDTRLRLEAADPTGDGVRGVVDFRPACRKHLTQLWVQRYG